MAQKRVLLLEPGYRNKYPPLGLMMLAAYHQSQGDHVRFVKAGIDDLGTSKLTRIDAWDRVYVTTLFSFEWRRTAAAIDVSHSRRWQPAGARICGGNCGLADAGSVRSRTEMGRCALYQGPSRQAASGILATQHARW